MTVGYRRFSRPGTDDVRMRRAIGQLVGGGSNSDLVLDPFGTGRVMIKGPLVIEQSFIIGAGTAGVDYSVTFNGETNDGVLTWMEDEDYFKFSDDVLMDSTEKVQFRDTAIYIYSANDGYLDLVADTGVRIGAPLSTGNLTVGTGAAGVDYTITFDGETNDGVITWMEDEDYFDFSDCLKTSGGRKVATVTVTDTYGVAAGVEVVVCNKASAFTVTLPDASGSGRVITVVNIGAGTVTLDGEGADTIAGDATQSVYQWESFQLVDYADEAWVVK